MIKMGKGYATMEELLASEASPEIAESYRRYSASKPIAGELYIARTDCGVSLEELAKRLGMSKRRVARMETDNDAVTFSYVRVFAAALGCDFTFKIANKNKKKHRRAARGIPVASGHAHCPAAAAAAR